SSPNNEDYRYDNENCSPTHVQHSTLARTGCRRRLRICPRGRHQFLRPLIPVIGDVSRGCCKKGDSPLRICTGPTIFSTSEGDCPLFCNSLLAAITGILPDAHLG